MASGNSRPKHFLDFIPMRHASAAVFFSTTAQLQDCIDQLPPPLPYQARQLSQLAGLFAACQVVVGRIRLSAGIPHSRFSFHAISMVRGRFRESISDARDRDPSNAARSFWL